MCICVFVYLTVGNISFDVLGPWAFRKYSIIRVLKIFWAWWQPTNEQQPCEPRASLLVEHWAKQTFAKISIQSVETPQCLNNLYNVLYLHPLQYLQNQFSAMKYAMSVLWLRFQGYLVCLYLLHVTQWPYGKKWPFHQVMEPSIDGRLEDQKDDDTFGGFPEILCQHQYMTTTSFFRMIIRMKT